MVKSTCNARGPGLIPGSGRFPGEANDHPLQYSWVFQVALVVKNPLANVGDIRDVGSIPGSGRSPGEGIGNPLRYSCLENPIDRGAWWAAIFGVTQSQTQLKRLSSSSSSGSNYLAQETLVRSLGQEDPLE